MGVSLWFATVRSVRVSQLEMSRTSRLMQSLNISRKSMPEVVVQFAMPVASVSCEALPSTSW